MNSFDFNQSPQSGLIEPANFVGPAQSSTTAQLSTSITEAASTESTLLSETAGLFYIVVTVVVVAAAVMAAVIVRRWSMRKN